MTLEEIIIEESHNLSFPHGRNLRSIAFHVRKLEDRLKQLEQENDALRADLLLWNEKEAKP